MPHGLAPTHIAVIGLLLLLAAPARATWSIVAVDPATRQAGIAGASCIEGTTIIAGLAPGHGAIAAQSLANVDGRDRGAALLTEGRSPIEVLNEITSEEFDPDHWIRITGRSWRQYGVASLDGPSQAAYTGDEAIAWKGSMESSGVVVAGNMLVGPDVVARALIAFETPPARGGCTPTLADRLVAALSAGADAGGDKRCVAELTALSAFVVVAEPDDAPDSPSLRIVVPYEGPREGSMTRQLWRFLRQKQGTAEENPVRKLRDLYLSWSERQGTPACLER